MFKQPRLNLKPGTRSTRNSSRPDLAELDVESGRHCEWTFKDPTGRTVPPTVTASTPRKALPIRSSAGQQGASSSYSERFQRRRQGRGRRQPRAQGHAQGVDCASSWATSPTSTAQPCARRRPRKWAGIERSPSGPGRSCSPVQPTVRQARRQQAVRFRGAPAGGHHVSPRTPDSARDLAFQSGELDMIYGKQDQAWMDAGQPRVKVKP